MIHPLIKNPHLDGNPFNMEGGSIGILLVHGFKATPAEMRPLGEFLHSKGFTVYGPLLPGHNTCPEDVNDYLWMDWITSIESSYHDLQRKCESIFIGGESLGALISIYLATYHPEIAGILAYAPALKLKLRRFEILALYLMSPFVPYIKQKDSDDDLAWRGYQANPLKGVIQLLRLQRETIPRLGFIRRPLLVVQGCQDARIPPEVPNIIIDNVNSVLKEIHWMGKSSHCVVLDKELESVQEITFNFINKSLGYTHA
jgi:carboxylesterase